MTSRSPGADHGRDIAGAVIATLLLTVPVAWWRSRPFPAALTAACAGIVAFATARTLNVLPETSMIPIAMLAYGAANGLARRHARLALGALLAGLTALAMLSGDGPALLYPVLGPWLAGRLTRSRRELANGLTRTAQELAAERRRYDEYAVLLERRRIARDLHDVIGHEVSLIVVQAAAGRHLLDREPALARGSLDAIDDAARQARAELHRLRGVLAPAEVARRSGLAALPDAIDRAVSAGLNITVHGLPVGVTLEPAADETAFRVVQEALTNVLRHCGAASVHIQLRVDGSSLAIDVTNGAGGVAPSGRALPPGAGSGLRGMRERVEALGGSLYTGPHGAGWTVRAGIPCRSAT